MKGRGVTEAGRARVGVIFGLVFGVGVALGVAFMSRSSESPDVVAREPSTSAILEGSPRPVPESPDDSATAGPEESPPASEVEMARTLPRIYETRSPGSADTEERAGAGAEQLAAFQDETRGLQERALAGDVQAAVEMEQLRRNCLEYFFRDADQVQETVDRLLRHVDERPRWREEGQFEQFIEGNFGVPGVHTPEALPAAMWRRFDECESVKDLFDAEWLARVERQAEAGVATARFMYAMMNPGGRGVRNPLKALSAEEMIEGIFHQQRALTWSMDLIEERNALGLLAFGLSFRFSIFTLQNPVNASSFLAAAAACGIRSPVAARAATYLANRSAHSERHDSWGDQVEDNAAVLSSMVCP